MARKLRVAAPDRYDEFKDALRELSGQGRIEMGKGHVVRPATATGLAEFFAELRRGPATFDCMRGPCLRDRTFSFGPRTAYRYPATSPSS